MGLEKMKKKAAEIVKNEEMTRSNSSPNKLIKIHLERRPVLNDEIEKKLSKYELEMESRRCRVTRRDVLLHLSWLKKSR